MSLRSVFVRTFMLAETAMVQRRFGKHLSIMFKDTP